MLREQWRSRWTATSQKAQLALVCGHPSPLSFERFCARVCVCVRVFVVIAARSWQCVYVRFMNVLEHARVCGAHASSYEMMPRPTSQVAESLFRWQADVGSQLLQNDGARKTMVFFEALLFFFWQDNL
jgi:hypothetical protein